MDDTSWEDDDQAGASVPCDDPKDADISAPRGDPNPKEAGRSTVDGCGALLNDPFPHDVAGSRLNDGNDPTCSDCPALPVRQKHSEHCQGEPPKKLLIALFPHSMLRWRLEIG